MNTTYFTQKNLEKKKKKKALRQKLLGFFQWHLSLSLPSICFLQRLSNSSRSCHFHKPCGQGFLMLTNQDVILTQLHFFRNGQDKLSCSPLRKLYHYKQKSLDKRSSREPLLIICSVGLPITSFQCANSQNGDCQVASSVLEAHIVCSGSRCTQSIAILPLCQTQFPTQHAGARTTPPLKNNLTAATASQFLNNLLPSIFFFLQRWKILQRYISQRYQQS